MSKNKTPRREKNPLAANPGSSIISFETKGLKGLTGQARKRHILAQLAQAVVESMGPGKSKELLQNALDAAYQEGRQHGYDEGYSRAADEFQRDLREWVANWVGGNEQLATSNKGRKTQEGRRLPPAEGWTPKPPRGTNAKIVEAILRHEDREMGPTEIQYLIKTKNDMVMAFTSIRHALDQLVKRGVAHKTGDATWRYVARPRLVGSS